MKRLQPEPASPRAALSPESIEANEAAWGSCEILLVADRVASLRTGSTHKVYRGWRFAATMQGGFPEPGTTLFSIPVDPAPGASDQTRYLLTRLAGQDAAAAGTPTAFSWSAASLGKSDPFAAALAQVRQNLDAAGWTEDATVPARYGRTDPPRGAGGPSELPATRAAAASIAAQRAMDSASLPLAQRLLATISPPEVSGLDGWETDGGVSSTAIAPSSLRAPGRNR